METAYGSDIGRRRSRNEDSVGVFENRAGTAFLILADGLGGYQGGEVASGMAVDHLGYLFSQTDIDSEDEAREWLEGRIADENSVIIARSRQYSDLEGMGTTIVCAIVLSSVCLIAHLGDSRAYLLHDGELRQVTEDHSLVNELVRRGEISEDEARHHPQKNIVTRTLGISENVTLDFDRLELGKGDRLMLCSDGLTNMVNDPLIEEVLKKDESLDDQCQELIAAANAGGGLDNITVLIARDGDES